MPWDSEMDADPPPPLNDGKFAASLGDQILGILAERPPAPPLDGDSSRHKLLFKGGMVYNFTTKTLAKAKPQDRMQFMMGCEFRPWQPPEGMDDIFESITEWCTKDKDIQSELWRKIEGKLRDLAQHCEVLAVLFKFAGSWDGVVYLLRTLTRAATGEPRICEFLYLYGPGSSGKDVVLMMFMAFFGEEPYNYAVVLNGGYVVDAKGSNVSKETATPFLAATQGKRMLWFSEVPEHKNLMVDLLKQYCEQNGARISARKLWKGPISFRPMGTIMLSSNYPPAVVNKDDDGFTRRSRVWQTTRTFATHPTTLTQHKADDTLKARILAGEFNSQLLWLVCGLVPSLSVEANPGTTIEPRPSFMKELEEAVVAGGSKAAFSSWLAEKCKPVPRKDATPIKEFRAAAMAALGLSELAIGPILTSAGMKTD